MLTILFIILGVIVLCVFPNFLISNIFRDRFDGVKGSAEFGIGLTLISLSLVFTTPISLYRTALVWAAIYPRSYRIGARMRC